MQKEYKVPVCESCGHNIRFATRKISRRKHCIFFYCENCKRIFEVSSWLTDSKVTPKQMWKRVWVELEDIFRERREAHIYETIGECKLKMETGGIVAAPGNWRDVVCNASHSYHEDIL